MYTMWVSVREKERDELKIERGKEWGKQVNSENEGIGILRRKEEKIGK